MTDVLELDEELLALAADIDNVDIPEPGAGSEAEPEQEEKPLFEDSEEEKVAEFALDSFETTVQVFFNERYEIGEAKKAVAVAAYGRLLKKHEGAAPSWLGQYKEEIICLLITLFIFVGAWRTVKVLNEQDRKQAEKAKAEASEPVESMAIEDKRAGGGDGKESE